VKLTFGVCEKVALDALEILLFDGGRVEYVRLIGTSARVSSRRCAVTVISSARRPRCRGGIRGDHAGAMGRAENRGCARTGSA